MTDQRSALIEGLRDLADFLDANPDAPMPFVGDPAISVYSAADPNVVAAWAAIPGGWEKNAYDADGGGGNFELIRKFGPIRFKVVARRDAVCERKVVGVETVEVPDPDAPKVTVEREVIEWDCKPILAKAVG